MAVTALPEAEEKSLSSPFSMLTPVKISWVASDTFTLRSEVLAAVPQLHTPSFIIQGFSRMVGKG